MKIIDRISLYIAYKGLNNLQFEKLAGLSNGYISKQLKRNGELSEGILLKILDNCLDISPLWLLQGKGDMLSTADKSTIISHTSTQLGIPLVNGTAIGGFGNNHFNILESHIKERYVIPKFEHSKVDFIIEVEGTSMAPVFNNGDLVACRIINEVTFIQFGKPHIVATNNQGIMIKRLRRSQTEGYLSFISENKEYDPFDVPESDITGIALVVGAIRLV